MTFKPDAAHRLRNSSSTASLSSTSSSSETSSTVSSRRSSFAKMAGGGPLGGLNQVTDWDAKFSKLDEKAREAKWNKLKMEGEADMHEAQLKIVNRFAHMIKDAAAGH